MKIVKIINTIHLDNKIIYLNKENKKKMNIYCIAILNYNK